MTRTSCRLLLAAFASVCVAVAAGCDGDESTPPSATTGAGTTSQTTTQETSSVAVYFLRGEKVSPVRRTIAATPAVARGALTELLAGPTEDEVASGLASAIPAGTALRDVSISDGVATVDLDGTFDDGGGSASMLGRVAQVVATLTRFPTVDRVAFRIDGRPVEAIGGEGVVVDPPIGRGAIEEQTPQILVESPLPGDTVTEPDPAARHRERIRGHRLDRREGRDGKGGPPDVHDRDLGDGHARDVRHDARAPRPGGKGDRGGLRVLRRGRTAAARRRGAPDARPVTARYCDGPAAPQAD